jgi:hypothetical protein
VVFILAADTGVTKSDLSIWREHLVTEGGGTDTRLVVLNKIDTLWDALSTPEQVQAQIDKQIAASAEILGLPCEQVIAVSAQKGLVAKVTGDQALLQASQLPALEVALGKGVMGQRQDILRSAVASGIHELKSEAGRTINMRRRDLAEQSMELRSLRGKNSSVIRHMRSRIEQEKAEFDASGARIFAVRSIHSKLLQEVIDLLSTPTLKVELADLNRALKQPGIKLGVKKAYGQTFVYLREGLRKSDGLCGEIHAMLASSFRELNAEFGFSLQAPAQPDLARYARDLELIEQSHLQYLGVANVLKLSRADFCERLMRALATRVRVVYGSALGEVELWNKSAASQLDVQLRERRRNFGRRLEAIERIGQAASGLDDRIHEIDGQEKVLNELDAKLAALTSLLTSAPHTFAARPATAPAPSAIPEAA